MKHEFEIESLDLEGRGVARHDGKVVFVSGALPGERVEAQVVRQKPTFDTARCERIMRPSAQRVTPHCPYFGVCGGCAMQHLSPAAQVAVKQRVLEDGFRHLAGLRPQQMLAPMMGPTWGYRHRARLSVRLVHKKGGVLVGFRERGGRYVTDMTACAVLPPVASALLAPLRDLIRRLSEPQSIPQIELAVGDAAVVLVLRHMQALTADDINLLRQFAASHKIIWWLQPKGPETAHPLERTDEDALYYDLPEFGLRMHFKPSDFTQVNLPINRRLVVRALDLLDVQSHHKVLDLFCGLGNFSLPLATRAAQVHGFEGSSTLVQRAQQAAVQHGLGEKTRFDAINLFEVDAAWLRMQGPIDRVLIDPPRDGAQAVAEALAALEPHEKPKKLVYVSCNPSTLARDAGILVGQGGYRLQTAGVVNMFPHTAHVESIAVFELA